MPMMVAELVATIVLTTREVCSQNGLVFWHCRYWNCKLTIRKRWKIGEDASMLDGFDHI